MLRHLLVSTAVVVAFSAPALAQDQTAVPVDSVLPYSWTGFYAGAHAGYGWGSQHDNLSVPTGGGAPDDSFNANGAVGGLHAGYNAQIDSIVFGLEADIDLSGISGSTHASVVGAEGSTISRLSLSSSWQGSVRARIGYAFDRLLIYGTGGVAFGDAKVSGSVENSIEAFDIRSGAYSGSQTQTLVGWTAGGGVEYAFDDHWSARFEARYTDFGKASYRLVGPGGTLRFKSGFDETMALVGVSYRF